MCNKELYSKKIATGQVGISEGDDLKTILRAQEDVVSIVRDSSTLSPRYKVLYKGKVVISMVRHVGEFHNGMARITYVGSKRKGWINSRGEKVLEDIDYDIISDFRNNVAIARNGLFGLVDVTGRILIPFKCDKIGSCDVNKGYYDYDIYEDSMFNTYLIPYKRHNSPLKKYYYIPLEKEMDFRRGYGIIKKGDFYGLFRVDLSEILPCCFKWMVRINETEFLMRKDENLIYYNADSETYIS